MDEIGEGDHVAQTDGAISTEFGGAARSRAFVFDALGINERRGINGSVMRAKRFNLGDMRRKLTAPTNKRRAWYQSERRRKHCECLALTYAWKLCFGQKPESVSNALDGNK